MNTEETIKNQESISDDNQDTDVKNTQKETENSDIQGDQETDSPSDSESSEDVKEDDNPEVCEEESDKLRSELDEYKDKYLRLMAEFDNYRKRVLKEKSELILNGGEKVISSILPVLDDIERAEESMTTRMVSKKWTQSVNNLMWTFMRP